MNQKRTSLIICKLITCIRKNISTINRFTSMTGKLSVYMNKRKNDTSGKIKCYAMLCMRGWGFRACVSCSSLSLCGSLHAPHSSWPTSQISAVG